MTTAFGENYGGTELLTGFGPNLKGSTGPLSSLRFALALDLPFYCDLKGIQLGKDYRLILGWQYAW